MWLANIGVGVDVRIADTGAGVDGRIVMSLVCQVERIRRKKRRGSGNTKEQGS